MPSVPLSPGATVQEQPLPTTPLRAADAYGGLADVGAALQQTGRTTTAMADEQQSIDAHLDEAAVKKVMVAGAARVRDRLWTGDNAFYSKDGFNAVNDRPIVEKDLQGIRADLAGQLTTDRQRRMFSDAWSTHVGAEEEGIARYAGQQTKVEGQRQSLARIKSSSEDALVHWGDPAMRETDIATAIGEVRSQAADQGWAPEVLKQAERETVSGIYSRAVQQQLDRGDVEVAHSTLEANRDKILPDAQGSLDLALKGPLEDRQAEGIIDMVRGTQTPLPAVSAKAVSTGAVVPRMQAITMGSESAGHDFDNSGHLLTSPKGAEGRMQVMPTTQTDPGYGVTPAKDHSPEELARVGRDYLAALYQHYGQDPAKTWAAYNWGPGNFDKAVAKYGADVMNHLPGETAAYVAGNMAALGGRGVNPVPQNAPQRVDLDAQLARVDSLNLPFDLSQKVKQGIRSRAVLDEGLLDRQRHDAQDQAFTYVNQLGKGFTNINQIPVGVRAQMSPEAVHSFMTLADANQKKDITTNWGAYAQYSDMYAKDPKSFAALNPATLRATLSDGDFKEVMGWRQHAMEAVQGKPDEHQVTYSRVDGLLNPMMEAAGIMKPIPTKPGQRLAGSGPDALTQNQTREQAWQQRRGKLLQSVMDDVEVWKKNNPTKQISDDVIHGIADQQLLRVWHRGDGSTATFAFERDPNDKRTWTFSLPNVDRDKIVGAYRRRWGRDPTDQEVSQIYRFGPRGGR